MALFGKKKLSLDEILKGIAELSEEEKEKVLSSIQGGKTETAPVAEGQETEAAEETMDESESVELEEPTSENEGNEISSENTETEPTTEESEDVSGEEIVTETDSTEAVLDVETTAELPAESPQAEETAQVPNYDELIQAQTARIDSLESQLEEFKARLERVVANQDKQDFGYSPKANFDEDVQTSRRDAILQSYAPRRADQYK